MTAEILNIIHAKHTLVVLCYPHQSISHCMIIKWFSIIVERPVFLLVIVPIADLIESKLSILICCNVKYFLKSFIIDDFDSVITNPTEALKHLFRFFFVSHEIMWNLCFMEGCTCLSLYNFKRFCLLIHINKVSEII